MSSSSLLLPSGWAPEIMWPDTLPVPLLERTHGHNVRNQVTQMESNRRRVRRLYEDNLETIQASWNFTEDEHDQFRDFFINQINQGVERFVFIGGEEPAEDEPFDTVYTFYEVAFLEGTYRFQRSDNLFAVSAPLLVTRKAEVRVEGTPPAPPEIPMTTPPTISYPDATCKDEVRIDWTPIVGVLTVEIWVGTDPLGPFEFWGETRKPEDHVIVSNYFAGKYVKLRVGDSTSFHTSVMTFDPPAVPPPVYAVELGKYHFDIGSSSFITTWYPPVLEPVRQLIYSAASVVDPTQTIGAVYTGNTTDFATSRENYRVPLFSDAFVEVGPRYWLDMDDGWTSYRINMTPITGATIKYSFDGADATPTHGVAPGTEIRFVSNPERKPFAIVRQFKDGCKSPPLYIMFDQSLKTGSTLSPHKGHGSGSASCNCWIYIWVEVPDDPGSCYPTPSHWDLMGTCPEPPYASPCSPLSTLQSDAEAGAAGNAVGATPAGDGSNVLNGISSGQTFESGPAYHYEGPDTGLCPSQPWGGGTWVATASAFIVKLMHYSWQSSYTSRPSDCFYLGEMWVLFYDSRGSVHLPPTTVDRWIITGLTGASGASTNDVGVVAYDNLPGEALVFPTAFSPVVEFQDFRITETICNS